jgi:hypothetical protein
MRDWARRELHGYESSKDAPSYRHFNAPAIGVITNEGGFNPRFEKLRMSMFNMQEREIMGDIVLEDAALSQGVGELEGLADALTGADEMPKLMPWWESGVIMLLNENHMGPNSVTTAVYWELSSATVRGVLTRIRTALAELVAELVILTPEHQEVPAKSAADQATQFVLTGDRPTVVYSPLNATNGGTAIGSQTASGAGSSIVGTQTVRGSHSQLAGRDSKVDGSEQAAPENWWTRLRKRGVVVAFATVVGGAAGVFAWIGWTPWH